MNVLKALVIFFKKKNGRQLTLIKDTAAEEEIYHSLSHYLSRLRQLR